MSEFISLSPEELATRRRQLRQQRRLRGLQTLWRTTAVSGLAAGACWLLAQPFWLIQSPAQVVVQGNERLTDETIQTLLPLDYPQSLLALEPEAIADLLRSQSPITEATVVRHLLPPRLEVWVQERQLVAVTAPVLSAQQEPGLLDAMGNWLPQASFSAFVTDWPLPTLVVEGYTPVYEGQWRSLYAALQASPITVNRLDWRDPSNLILHTNQGIVHLGPYEAHQFAQQLKTLAQLRPLMESDQAPPQAYLDLSNPEQPVLQGATLDTGSRDGSEG
ncbi:cell division protein FtsQ/DivIB [Leptolyngbya sp. PCC 6406]|uniref:cell division protein FtsQ/DivIB n=1 Tax=Leptolyngbya sp. PCC 6406 TaxID=1173264 RepID=UPI0002AC380A|nr:FtsQ-type POTRA domain-containing protein [Leptolyngbya sp. PCC 6406]